MLLSSHFCIENKDSIEKKCMMKAVSIVLFIKRIEFNYTNLHLILSSGFSVQ